MTHTTVRVLRGALSGLGAAVLVVLLMLYLGGRFHPKVSSDAPAPSHVPIGSAALAPVVRVTIPATESAVGTVRPVYESQVASRILEKVTAVSISAGQAVKKADVLVTLDDTVLKAQWRKAQAAVDAAQAACDQARIEAEANRRLAQVQVAARIEMERTEAALKTAEADLKRAQETLGEARSALDYATVRAPSDGLVVDKRVNVGDTVMPGTVLLTLYDPERMQLVASVRESLAQRLKVGQEIGVHIDALHADCAGTVSEIVPESQSASRSFLVKVVGPCHPGVYAGMYGRLAIPLDRETVLVVPASGLMRVGQLDMVRLAVGDRLERRAVQVGRSLVIQGQSMVEVLAGLTEGQRVALPAAVTTASGSATRPVGD
jgi:RND family efflux transporter MFP subunit